MQSQRLVKGYVAVSCGSPLEPPLSTFRAQSQESDENRLLYRLFYVGRGLVRIVRVDTTLFNIEYVRILRGIEIAYVLSLRRGNIQNESKNVGSCLLLPTLVITGQ